MLTFWRVRPKKSATGTFNLYWAGKNLKEICRSVNEVYKEEPFGQNQKRWAIPSFPLPQNLQLGLFSCPIFVRTEVISGNPSMHCLWRNLNWNSITRVLLVYLEARVLDRSSSSLILLFSSLWTGSLFGERVKKSLGERRERVRASRQTFGTVVPQHPLCIRSWCKLPLVRTLTVDRFDLHRFFGRHVARDLI